MLIMPCLAIIEIKQIFVEIFNEDFVEEKIVHLYIQKLKEVATIKICKNDMFFFKLNPNNIFNNKIIFI